MPTGIYKHGSPTLETRKKISLSKLGDKNPMKRPEVAIKVSQARMGTVSPKRGKRYEELYGETKASAIKAKLRKSHLGQIPWNKNKTGIYNDETLKKIGNASKENQSWKFTLKHKLRGKEHPNWKDGRTKLQEKIRKSPRYAQWRTEVFQTDNFTCRGCGTKGSLVAHHIKAFNEILEENKIDSLEKALDCEELWNVNNGLTLCKKCHKLTDNYLGKAKDVRTEYNSWKALMNLRGNIKKLKETLELKLGLIDSVLQAINIKIVGSSVEADAPKRPELKPFRSDVKDKDIPVIDSEDYPKN